MIFLRRQAHVRDQYDAETLYVFLVHLNDLKYKNLKLQFVDPI
jgi:hypothetical protein